MIARRKITSATIAIRKASSGGASLVCATRQKEKARTEVTVVR
jgi:hypothetical protein